LSFHIDQGREKVKITSTAGIVDLRPGMDSATMMKKAVCAKDYCKESGGNGTAIYTQANEYKVFEQFVK